MKFEDLKLGGWYTHPDWNGPRRVWTLIVAISSTPAVARLDSGPGSPNYVSVTSNDATLIDLTEYDEYADAKALVEMRRSVYAPVMAVLGWHYMNAADHNSYKSLAAQLREQGWRGASK
jgi:hypothetical protein